MSATIDVRHSTVGGYPQIARQFVTEHQAVVDRNKYISKEQVERKDLVSALQISAPDFGLGLSAPIVDISSRMPAGEVGILVALDEQVLVRFSLTGYLCNEDGLFRIEHVGVRIEEGGNRARSDFVASTFWAVLGLSENVRLQWVELQLDLTLQFHLGLSAVSEMLERRLLAHRIMVIERATNRRFDLPSFVTAENVKSIALIYHAVVHRSFVWPIGFVEYGWPANKEVAESLLQVIKLPFIRLGPHPQNETLFGQSVPLGEGFIVVQDQVIDDFDSTLKELCRDDGHVVRVLIRSRTGQGGYDFPNAPRLPLRPWDLNIQRLVDLETVLDTRLAQRYNDLAAATLANLTKDEQKEVTSRPTLEDAITFDN